MNGWYDFNKLNLPNKLTLFRILLLPLLMLTLLSETLWGKYLAWFIFVLAALTDYWDGYIARKYNLITSFGKVMDPLADKLLMTTVFISFVELDFVPAWMVILIIGREFAITGLRVLAANQGNIIAASRSGKNKTISQIGAILVILTVNVIVGSLQAWAPPWEKTLAALGNIGEIFINIIIYSPYICMAVATILSLYSGLEYLVKNKKIFAREK